MRFTDSELARILRTLTECPNDPDAWRSLYSGLWPYVVATVSWNLNGQIETAEDISQHVFLDLLKSSRKGRIPDQPHRFRNLLKTICRRRVIDYYRSKSGKDIYLSQRLEQLIGTPAEPVSSRLAPDTERILEEMVQSLDRLEMELIDLSVRGFTYRQIAQELGLPVSTVHRHIVDLKKRLFRAYLSSKGE